MQGRLGSDTYMNWSDCLHSREASAKGECFLTRTLLFFSLGPQPMGSAVYVQGGTFHLNLESMKYLTDT